MGHLVTAFDTIITMTISSSLHATAVSWQESSPSPSLVELAGSFSSWSPLPMTRGDEGTWSAVLELASGRHEYKVIVDGDWRVDESVEMVNNDMGSWNNVLHVEEDKDEEVEETDVEVNKDEEVQETDVEEDKDEEVEETHAEEGRNEEVNKTVKDKTHVEEDRNEEVNETVKDKTDLEEERNEEVNETDVDQDITTESKDEEKGETSPKPNFVMTRAVAIEQKMRDLEEGVENLMLNSPVRVTRGKLKKFVQENDSTPAKC